MAGSVSPIVDALAVGSAGFDGYFNRASNNLIRNLCNAPFSANEHWAAERLPRAGSHRPETETALAFFALSHFRTEIRISLFLKML
jgi:hypothetical protein